jgi:hypothetical protein
MRFASSVVASMDHGVFIDGIEFPWYVSAADFEIDPGGPDKLTSVHLNVLVLGTVTYSDAEGRRRVIDQEFGDVADYARALVRAGLAVRVPWLDVS